MSIKIFVLFTVVLSIAFSGCKKKDEKNQNSVNMTELKQASNLYSYIGSEYEVSYTALVKTDRFTADQVINGEDYYRYAIDDIAQENIRYLFGPLTHRNLGGMKLDYKIEIDFTKAQQVGSDVVVPYVYKGTWILENQAAAKALAIPVPYNSNNLLSSKWLSCTDSDPDHQTESFYWYFWDPTRAGCDHKLNIEYQIVNVALGAKTVNQASTFPEYKKIIQSNGINNNLQMTFAFGYVTDPSEAHPETDSDYGVGQYRTFVKYMDKQAKTLNLVKTPIKQQEYLNPSYPDKVIGYRYAGIKEGVKVEVKIVAAADIDQMELFAKSYAHDHDGYFGWFGHSRVGSGFDATNFASIVRRNPEFYSLSENYQLVYWAGCNSYSYYTLPFFEQKSNLDRALDPKGTKNLDIIANALPSLFSFNAENAAITFQAMINWNKPTSYQDIITKLEKYAQRNGTTVIVNVLGDEDNVKP